ncbi:MetQ/NlpA family ABC transporter substrate-binding protein [Entomospira culicis]|uniref:Methionine ABC transporter substrate-binding protein n=1 Tax=Entomospira culicis TaxID=2719989 RepID=A0A968KUB1_9SPIO|nr:MetQ/NlpA family ABC transporter substrate-binding protein [Entomospira culicis]NIZ19150.1 methionine ABC transporter substrate-binding protein [Entomospira culicis]NIZ69364.1 methionine ABC transporter substrate-binding protein [Entomospira culicis]WDI37949.1 MetQ/NlpA family ABC transporter substrate-binding protein [Entomospira culicis]WDI38107.1 MetQ/NlpA family ABC transporter substrate-binding protein [Entomospira culicis]
MKRNILFAILASLALISCPKKENEKVIRVVASSVPHAVILEQAIPMLKKEGYTLKIEEVNDYNIPNRALLTRSADANFFQHEPFLNQFNRENQSAIIPVAQIHIEPIGLYSQRIDKRKPLLDQLSDGDLIIMSNSPSDQGRLLFLLQEANLITLNPNVTSENARLEDITSMAKQFIIRNDVAPELLVSMYKNNEAKLILINGNFALTAQLNPLEDAILLESGLNNPYSNILAALAENQNTPKMQALIRALTSKEMSTFINNTYKGTVIPINN